MKRRRKLLSILLSLAMVVGMIPAFGITASALDQLTNVQVSSQGILSWDAYPGAKAYFFSIASGGGYVDENSIDLKRKCQDYAAKPGTYQVTIYALSDLPSNGGMQLTEKWTGTYNYQPKGKLSSPKNLQWQGTVAKWDPVPNADVYEWFLYDEKQWIKTEKVTSTQVDVSKLEKAYLYVIGGKYQFSVRAIDYGDYQASDQVYSSFTTLEPMSKTLGGTVTVTADPGTLPGGKLTAVPQLDASSGTTLMFQWQSRINGDAAAENISDEVLPTYTIPNNAAAGTQIRVVITAVGYSGYVNSDWVTVKETPACEVKVSAGTANKTTAKKGETVNLIAIPGGSDFTFDSWDPVAGGMSLKSLGSSSTTFTMPGNDVKISGRYKIKSTAGTNSWSGKTNPFVDVSKGTYYYDPVLWAYYSDPQVTNGMDATHFGPSSTVTRGQAVTFLWRAKGCPEPTTKTNPFVDVPESQYYYKPILWAVEKGITKGTDVNHFSPNQKLSTAHIVTFLYRTLEKGSDGWYKEAGNWAQSDGLLDGTGLGVSDKTDCPRGAVVTFLYRELANAASGVNELSKDDFLMYVEESYDITGRGRVITGRVMNGSIRTGNKVTLISCDESTKAPVRATYTVGGIEMFHKILDEAEKGDNVGILLSADTSIKTPSGSALVNEGSSLKSSPGRFVGTVKMNNESNTKTLTLGDTFQAYWAGYDVTAMLVDLNGGDITPNTTREGVRLTLLYPAVLYVGQELTIREGGRTYGTFTVTGIE